MKKHKHCTMPECIDFPVKGDRWCAFHIKDAEKEFGFKWPAGQPDPAQGQVDAIADAAIKAQG